MPSSPAAVKSAAAKPASKPAPSKPAPSKPEQPAPEEKPGSDHALLLLGLISTGIALATTIVSLVLYHNSGDIYLDRSRPGFLPDEAEVEQAPSSVYTFPSSGTLTEENLEDYIKNFNDALERIDDLKSPWAEDPLSNNSLGIPEDYHQPDFEDGAPE